MKITLGSSTRGLLTRRCFSSASKRDTGAELQRGFSPARNRFSKLGTLLLLSSALALTAQPVNAQAPSESAVPPPSAPPRLSAADLEKLLMPIALYPDSLIATMLPAAVYPLEIVQAARFLADTNNASKIDQQTWDENVKAVAKVPAALKKMNDDLTWTMQLGEAFLNQDKDVMDTIQSLRGQAQKAGTLKTTEQQIVIVTNTVVEKTVEQRVVVVTNTIVQIQSANPQVIYVPAYPYTVYYPPPGPPPLLTFAAGVAVGAIIANNCDWHGGGIYVGHHGAVIWGGGGYHGDVDIKIDNSVNIDNSRGGNVINNSGNKATQYKGGQKWQPDQNRVKASGTPTSAKTMEARGWRSSAATAGTRPSAPPSTGDRGGSAMASSRPSSPSAGTRPSDPRASTRASAPGTLTRPATTASTRPSEASSASQSANRLSAFSRGGGASKQASQRGAASRSGGTSRN